MIIVSILIHIDKILILMDTLAAPSGPTQFNFGNLNLNYKGEDKFHLKFPPSLRFPK